MNNTLKKFLGLMFTAVMVFSMSATAFAAPTTYSITLENAKPDHTYGAYQVFKGELFVDPAAPEGTVPTLSSIKWGDSVTDSAALLNALQDDTVLDTAFDTCTTAEAVADVLATLPTDKVTQFSEVVGNWLRDTTGVTAFKTSGTYDVTAKTYTIAELPAGYYLVKDDAEVEADASTRYILNVVKDVKVSPKAGVPTVEKKVEEDTNIPAEDEITTSDQGDYNDVADWEIGQVKHFKIYATLPEEMWNYKTYELQLGDNFDKGFTIVDTTGKQLPEGVINAANYKVTYIVGTAETTITTPFTTSHAKAVGEADGTISFTCADIKKPLIDAGVTPSGEITVAIEYSAMLNENAVVGFGGNVNDVTLKYSNDPYSTGLGETEKDEVVVFTFTLEGLKTDDSTPAKTLAGAQFVLVSKESGAEQFAVLTGDALTSWTSDITKATKITSDENGVFTVNGVDSGDYILREIKAPDGYNMLEGDVAIHIESQKSGSDIYTQGLVVGTPTSAIDKLVTNVAGEDGASNDGTVNFTIVNKAGSKLPSTGDTGSLFFYAFGAIGAAACIVMLITKKRMNKYSNR